MTRKEKPVEKEAPAAAPAVGEREPDFLWDGRPVYRCQLGCGDRFERVENLAAVLEHEETQHGTKVIRESLILGPDGRPAQVEGESE